VLSPTGATQTVFEQGPIQVGFAANGAFACNIGAGSTLADPSLTDGAWHHWACVGDSTSNTRVLYRDGVRVYSAPAPVTVAPSAVARIGAGFAGQLDELAVYDSAASDAFVQEQAAARYNFDDAVLRPNQGVTYDAKLSNELLGRYVLAALNTLAPEHVVDRYSAPDNFILKPGQTVRSTGWFTTATTAPGGQYSVTQIAAGGFYELADLGVPLARFAFDSAHSTNDTRLVDSSGLDMTGHCASAPYLVAHQTCTPQYVSGNSGNGLQLTLSTRDVLTPYPSVRPYQGMRVAIEGLPQAGHSVGMWLNVPAATDALINPIDQKYTHGLLAVYPVLNDLYEVVDVFAIHLRRYTDSANGYGLCVLSRSGMRWCSTGVPVGAADGQWRLLQLSYTPDFNGLNLYLDRTRVGLSEVSGAPCDQLCTQLNAVAIPAMTADVYLGVPQSSSIGNMTLGVDDVTLLPRALTYLEATQGFALSRLSFDNGVAGGIVGKAGAYTSHRTQTTLPSHPGGRAIRSAAIWFKPSAPGSLSPQRIFDFDNPLTSCGGGNVTLVNSQLSISDGGSPVWATQQIVTDTWYHVGFSHLPNGTIRWYLNGTPVANQPAFSFCSAIDGVNGYAVGGNAAGTQPYQGLLDEARVWNVDFSDADFARAYQSTFMALALPFDDTPSAGFSLTGIRNEATTDPLGNARCSTGCPSTGYPGRDRGAAFFDGGDDGLTVAAPELSPTQSFLVSYWGKRQPFAEPMTVLARAGRLGVNYTFDAGFDAAGHPTCRFNPGITLSAAPINDFGWHHYACGFDERTQRVHLYVDGVEATTASATYGMNATGVFSIGRGITGTAFSGALDRVQVSLLPPTLTNTRQTMRGVPTTLLHFDDQNNGDPAVDPQRYRNEPTNTDAMCTSDCPVKQARGKVGPAISLDGVSQTLRLSNTVVFSPTDDALSVSFWIRTEDISTRQSLAGLAGVFEAQLEPFNDLSATLRLGFWHSATTGVAPALVISGGRITPRAWTHVAFTWQRNDALIAYVNGDPVARATIGADALRSTGALRIGGPGNAWASATRLFGGSLDAFTVYHDALTPQAIKSIYATQLRYADDRQYYGITVDAEAPVSQLETVDGQPYRPNRYTVLAATTGDATSYVQMVELGVSRQFGGRWTDPVWTASPQCVDAPGVWCMSFDPALHGGEGIYRLQTRATDAVGRAETPTREDILYIDGRGPVVTVNINSNSLVQAVSRTTPGVPAITPVLALSGTVIDPLPGADFAASGVEQLRVTLFDRDGAVVDQSRVLTPTGAAWALDIPLDREPGGAYTLTVEALDKAGNQSVLTRSQVNIDLIAPQVTLSTRDVISLSNAVITGTVLDPLSYSSTLAAGVTAVDLGYAPQFDPRHVTETQPAGQIVWLSFDESNSAAYRNLATTPVVPATCTTGTCPLDGVQGIREKAAAFDGISDTLSLPGQRIPTGSFTVAFWARRDSSGSDDVAVAQGGGRFGFDAANRFMCDTGSGALTTAAIGSPGVWQHWACIYDAASGARTIYRDGEPLVNDTTSNNLSQSADLQIGSAAGGGHFGGALDDLRVLNRPLDAASLRGLMHRRSLLAAVDADAGVDSLYDGASLVSPSQWAQRFVFSSYDSADHALPGHEGAHAIALDGLDDSLHTTETVPLKDSAFTVSFWARRASTGTDDIVLSQGTGAAQQTLRVGFTAANAFVCDLGGDALISAGPHTDADWHHWACTLDPETQRRTLYRDGTAIVTGSLSNSYTGSGDLFVGRASTGGGFFHGDVDSVRVHSAALSDREIALLAQQHWQPATVAAGAWQASAPTGIEGQYVLHARARDAFDNDIATQSRSVFIDTLAPRISAISTTLGAQSIYTVSIHDVALDLAQMTVAPACAAHTQMITRTNAEWYVGRFDPVTGPVVQLDYVCAINVPEAAHRLTSCDDAGNCSVYEFGAPQPTATPSPTATQTPTPTLTSTATITPTTSPTVTPTMSTSPTVTPTLTASPTVTPTLTASPTVTPTETAAATATVTPTMTASPAATHTPTLTSSPTVTPTAAVSPSPTVTPTLASTPTSTATRTPIGAATSTATPPTPTSLETPEPTCGDGFEPDTLAPPGLALGSPQPRVLCDTDDVDTALITTTFRGSWRIKLADLGISDDVVIEVLAPDGSTVIARSSGTAVLDFTAGPGTFFVRISRRDGASQPARYRLQFSSLDLSQTVYLPVVTYQE
jgi:Concanavalin A-like lectin/glucanases superfamily